MLPLTSSTFIVTGAAGFLGSALVWRLNTRGAGRIIACDRDASPARSRNLRPLKIDAYVASDDLLRSPYLRECDAVIHLGACSSTTETNAEFLQSNNTDYTRHLAEAALELGKKFVYASSAATYGSGEGGMSDMGDPRALPKPNNLYARSKHHFDCLAAKEGYLSEIVGLKYFNVLGPNEDHKGTMRSFAAKAYDQARKQGRVAIFRSEDLRFAHGDQERDFIYVKDAVDATIHLLESGARGGLYNVGTGSANTWNFIAQIVFNALGLPPSIDYIHMPEAIRKNYQYSTRANIGKLRAAGFAKPMRALGDSVREYVSEYLVPGRVLGEVNPPCAEAVSTREHA